MKHEMNLVAWRLGGSILVPALSWRAWRLVFLLVVFTLTPAAFAGEAKPAAEDPALEARVNALANELRCLVCQNQTLADSNAPLAVDLRNQIRERMQQGASEGDIIGFMVERYGDFVLYRPPFKSTTLLLWAGPMLLMIAGLGALYHRLARRRREVAKPELSGEERARAAALLSGKADAEKR
jgi:cytochrome c-type biogenesis protein CcmH